MGFEPAQVWVTAPPFTHPSTHVPNHPPIYPSIHPSTYLPIHPCTQPVFSGLVDVCYIPGTVLGIGGSSMKKKKNIASNFRELITCWERGSQNSNHRINQIIHIVTRDRSKRMMEERPTPNMRVRKVCLHDDVTFHLRLHGIPVVCRPRVRAK